MPHQFVIPENFCQTCGHPLTEIASGTFQGFFYCASPDCTDMGDTDQDQEYVFLDQGREDFCRGT